MQALTAPSAWTEPGPITLSAGQTQWLLVRRGDALLAADSGIKLTEVPLWLAERWIETTLRLDVGTRHAIERGGWVRVQASRPSRLTLLARPPRGARLLRFAWWARRPAMRPAHAPTC